MDEPLVRYTTTADGVRIAYWTLGAGRPLVILPTLLYSHLSKEWQTPEWRRCYEIIASAMTLVRFDGRGNGMSEGGTHEYSLETMVSDLDGVVSRVGQERVTLFGVVNSCAVAVAYAVQFPESVSEIILWCPMVDGSVMSDNPGYQAARKLGEADWVAMSEAIAHNELGWTEPDAARRYAALMREGVTREVAFQQLPAIFGANVRNLLSEVRCPVLVMHRPDTKVLPAGEAERVAADIPGATLRLLEGASTSPFLGDWRSVVRTLADFLGVRLTPLKIQEGGRALRLLSMRSDTLTPRERQIVELVARGLTNREIAQELFLAEKTVGNHVSRILTKLDLRSRTQLAAYAVEHGVSSRPA